MLVRPHPAAFPGSEGNAAAPLPTLPTAPDGAGKRSQAHAQAPQGPWDYDFKPVFFLGFLNFDIRHLDPEKADPSRFIHKFSLLEEETNELMSRALRFAFMEVARFDKTIEECKSFEDRFLYLMKNLPTFAEKPELWDDMDPYFNDLMEEASFANLSWEEQEKYIASMKQKWDYQNTLDFAEMKGREAGKEEGREEERIVNARNLLKLGVPVKTISEGLGLTEEEIAAL